VQLIDWKESSPEWLTKLWCGGIVRLLTGDERWMVRFVVGRKKRQYYQGWLYAAFCRRAAQISEARFLLLWCVEWNIKRVTQSLTSSVMCCWRTSDEDLFTKISIGQLFFPSPSWDSISNLAKVILRTLYTHATTRLVLLAMHLWCTCLHYGRRCIS